METKCNKNRARSFVIENRKEWESVRETGKGQTHGDATSAKKAASISNGGNATIRRMA